MGGEWVGVNGWGMGGSEWRGVGRSDWVENG